MNILRKQTKPLNNSARGKEVLDDLDNILKVEGVDISLSAI